jgi:hypothetical protein
MKVDVLGSNKIQVHLKNDMLILYSYRVPVAMYLPDQMIWVRTSHKWSDTTFKHINQWLYGRPSIEVTQSFIDNLVENI